MSFSPFEYWLNEIKWVWDPSHQQMSTVDEIPPKPTKNFVSGQTLVWMTLTFPPPPPSPPSSPTHNLPSGWSSSTPTQLPGAKVTGPTKRTTPVLLGPVVEVTVTPSPSCTQPGTGPSSRRSRSARLPKEHSLTLSSSAVEIGNVLGYDFVIITAQQQTTQPGIVLLPWIQHLWLRLLWVMA